MCDFTVLKTEAWHYMYLICGACLQNPTSIYMLLSKSLMYTEPRARYIKQMTNLVAVSISMPCAGCVNS